MIVSTYGADIVEGEGFGHIVDQGLHRDNLQQRKVQFLPKTIMITYNDKRYNFAIGNYT